MNDREAFCGRGLVKNPTYLYLDNGGFYLATTVDTVSIHMHQLRLYFWELKRDLKL